MTITITYIITLAAAFVIVARLLTFRRRKSRYRPGVAVLAWLVIVTATVVAIFGLPADTVARWLIAIAMVALAIGLIRTGGNVAHLIRPRRQ